MNYLNYDERIRTTITGTKHRLLTALGLEHAHDGGNVIEMNNDVLARLLSIDDAEASKILQGKPFTEFGDLGVFNWKRHYPAIGEQAIGREAPQ